LSLLWKPKIIFIFGLFFYAFSIVYYIKYSQIILKIYLTLEGILNYK
jgi:zona occludens toxin (predicted ATPase)